MKKCIACIILLFAVLCIGACRVQEEYSFSQSVDNISYIAIATAVFDEEGWFSHIEKTHIEDVEGFINNFRKIPCYIWFGDPIGIPPECDGENLIKIVYTNGDYELIHWSGQAEYVEEHGFQMYAGFSVFDEEQFKAFAASYTV